MANNNDQVFNNFLFKDGWQEGKVQDQASESLIEVDNLFETDEDEIKKMENEAKFKILLEDKKIADTHKNINRKI